MTKSIHELRKEWLEAEDVYDAAYDAWDTSVDKESTALNAANKAADEAYTAYHKAKGTL